MLRDIRLWRPKPVSVRGTLEPVSGPSVWYGRDLESDSSWIYRWTKADISEIEAALSALPAGVSLQNINRQNFPLPKLGSMLEERQREIIEGRGFVLFKGLPIARYKLEQLAAIYWGIGQYFGTPVSQNADGHLLGHVKNMGHDTDDPRYRGYQTRGALRYHTDSCDIVGLLCRYEARVGGQSSIVSSAALHNVLLETAPKLLDVLYQPFAISRIGEIPAGKMGWYPMPIFNQYAGHMTSMYPARDIRMAQSIASAPRLSAVQMEALERLDELAEQYSLKMEIEPGDIQLLHNHSIYHARTGYEDFVEPHRKRHLLRLWLSAENGRPLPPCFAERYGTVAAGSVRGGINCPDTKLCAPLDLN